MGKQVGIERCLELKYNVSVPIEDCLKTDNIVQLFESVRNSVEHKLEKDNDFRNVGVEFCLEHNQEFLKEQVLSDPNTSYANVEFNVYAVQEAGYYMGSNAPDDIEYELNGLDEKSTVSFVAEEIATAFKEFDIELKSVDNMEDLSDSWSDITADIEAMESYYMY